MLFKLSDKDLLYYYYYNNNNYYYYLKLAKIPCGIILSISVRLPHEIFNNVIGATSKASDQPEHTRVACSYYD